MNDTNSVPELQERIQSIASKIAGDKVLGGLFSKDDLQNFLVDGLTQMLNSSLQLQRKIHLDHSPEDRANGYAPERIIHLGTTPIPIAVPRTRQAFYPPILPKYQRHTTEAYGDLL